MKSHIHTRRRRPYYPTPGAHDAFATGVFKEVGVFRRTFKKRASITAPLPPPQPPRRRKEKSHLQEFLWLPSVAPGEVDIPAGGLVALAEITEWVEGLATGEARQHDDSTPRKSADHNNTCPPCILTPCLPPRTCSSAQRDAPPTLRRTYPLPHHQREKTRRLDAVGGV